MSIKSKVFAAAATLTLVGGVGSVAALSAGAATPSCGNHCIDIFSREFGTHDHPNFVVDTLRQGAKVGQPVILFRTSNTDPAEDFTPAFQGLTSEFNAAGLVSNAVALHYGCAGQFGANSCTIGVDDPAFEIEYAPYGVDSGLCMGVAATASQNEGVTLQPCGVSSKTVWILDLNDSPSTINHDYVPLINGSDTNFSHPPQGSVVRSGAGSPRGGGPAPLSCLRPVCRILFPVRRVRTVIRELRWTLRHET